MITHKKETTLAQLPTDPVGQTSHRPHIYIYFDHVQPSVNDKRRSPPVVKRDRGEKTHYMRRSCSENHLGDCPFLCLITVRHSSVQCGIRIHTASPMCCEVSKIQQEKMRETLRQHWEVGYLLTQSNCR